MPSLFRRVMAIYLFSSLCFSGEGLTPQRRRYSFPANSETMTGSHKKRFSRGDEYLPAYGSYHSIRDRASSSLSANGVNQRQKTLFGNYQNSRWRRRTSPYFSSQVYQQTPLRRRKRKETTDFKYDPFLSEYTRQVREPVNSRVVAASSLGEDFASNVRYLPYSYRRRKRYPVSLRYGPAFEQDAAQAFRKRYVPEDFWKDSSRDQDVSFQDPLGESELEKKQVEKQEGLEGLDNLEEFGMDFEAEDAVEKYNPQDTKRVGLQNEEIKRQAEGEIVKRNPEYRMSSPEELGRNVRSSRVKAILNSNPREMQRGLQRLEQSHHPVRLVHRLFLPNVNKTAVVYFSRTAVPTMSHAIHRIMRKYYYLVIRLSLRMRSEAKQISFFRKFNEKILYVLDRLIHLRSHTNDPMITRSNWYLKNMMQKVHAYNNNPFPPRDIPFRDHLVAGQCAEYVGYQEFPILKPYFHMFSKIRFRVNMGPITEVVWRQWRREKCPKFFENAYKYQIPYADEDGVNILAPRVLNEDQVYIRGPTVYSRQQCFNRRQLMTFYRCQMMRITTVKLKEARECYFSHFHRNMLVTVKDIYNISGAFLPPSYGRIQNWLRQRPRRAPEPIPTLTIKPFREPWDNGHRAVMKDMADLLGRKLRNLNKTKVFRTDTVLRGRVRAVGTEIESDEFGFFTFQRLLLIYYVVMIILLLILAIVFAYNLVEATRGKRNMQCIYSEFRYSSLLTDPNEFKD